MNNIARIWYYALLCILDSVLLIPLSTELFLLNYPYFISYVVYIVFSIIGSVISYLLGYYFYDKVSKLILVVLNIMSINPQTYYNALSYDISKLILLKCFVPIVPIGLINYIAGYQKINLIWFIILSLFVRCVRSLIFIFLARIKVFSNISYIIICLALLRSLKLVMVIYYQNIMYL